MASQCCTDKDYRRVRQAAAGLPSGKQSRESLHANICNGCGGLILGTRYKCLECHDFDLCAGCLRSAAPPQRPGQGSEARTHPGEHALVVLCRPVEEHELEYSLRFGASLLQEAIREEELQADEAISARPCPRGCMPPQSSGSALLCTRCAHAPCPTCLHCCGAPSVRFVCGTTREHGALQRRGMRLLELFPWPAELATQDLLSAPPEAAPAPEAPRGAQGVERECAVRPMGPQDLDAVLSVESISFVEPYSKRTFQKLLELSSSRCYVVDVQDSFGGYLILDVGAAAQMGCAYVVSLAVLPTCRGCGAAERMLRAALEEAAGVGAGCVELHVHSMNLGAQRLYSRCGFQKVAEEPGYYGWDDELQKGDAFVMRAALREPEEQGSQEDHMPEQN